MHVRLLGPPGMPGQPQRQLELLNPRRQRSALFRLTVVLLDSAVTLGARWIKSIDSGRVDCAVTKSTARRQELLPEAPVFRHANCGDATSIDRSYRRDMTWIEITEILIGIVAGHASRLVRVSIAHSTVRLLTAQILDAPAGVRADMAAVLPSLFQVTQTTDAQRGRLRR